eukprot:gene1422-6357_t
MMALVTARRSGVRPGRRSRDPATANLPHLALQWGRQKERSTVLLVCTGARM